MRRLFALLILCLVVLGLFAQKSEARLSNNNRRAVVLEAFYALHPGHGGWSDKWIGPNCASNWNYLANDSNAYGVVKNWSGYGCSFASVWKVSGDGCSSSGWPASFFNNMVSYGYGSFSGWYGSVGRGGQCKYFANLILYRSESHQAMFPSYATMWSNTETNLALAKEGDVILTVDQGITNHVAIVVEVKKSGSTVTGLDVIDANWVTDNGTTNREVIARHLFSLASIQGVYRIWKGTAYYNEQYVP
ncbi:MAG: hypothetical protein AAB667_02060 [Patescibacteria group bacterium]